jgi:NAD dependent epimerase/dehydratase family enzyme
MYLPRRYQEMTTEELDRAVSLRNQIEKLEKIIDMMANDKCRTCINSSYTGFYGDGKSGMSIVIDPESDVHEKIVVMLSSELAKLKLEFANL